MALALGVVEETATAPCQAHENRPKLANTPGHPRACSPRPHPPPTPPLSLGSDPPAAERRTRSPGPAQHSAGVGAGDPRLLALRRACLSLGRRSRPAWGEGQVGGREVSTGPGENPPFPSPPHPILRPQDWKRPRRKLVSFSRSPAWPPSRAPHPPAPHRTSADTATKPWGSKGWCQDCRLELAVGGRGAGGGCHSHSSDTLARHPAGPCSGVLEGQDAPYLSPTREQGGSYFSSPAEMPTRHSGAGGTGGRAHGGEPLGWRRLAWLPDPSPPRPGHTCPLGPERLCGGQPRQDV